MHCNYCEPHHLAQSRHYNIEHVRQRFNPTYFHSQIFGNTQPIPSKVRCTPTFHSQAFRVDGYGHNCKGKCAKKPEAVQNKTNVGGEVRKTYKNGDFANVRGKSCYNGRVRWYDEQKNEKFNHIQSTYDYSKERKYADLASSSVFDNYVYHPHNQLCSCVKCNCVNCQCGQNANQQVQSNKIQVNRPQINGCQVCNCVNCQCAAKQTQCVCADKPQTKAVVQAPKQCCNCCTNCHCANCQCGKPVEVKTCNCSNCQCVNCQCESGCCQKVPQNQVIVEQAKPVVSFNNKGVNQQVTFGKKGAANTQKGCSQPKKVIKQKPTYTVIRQKK